jgi:methylenetetrahydrofolate dehydrogenase (NADP+)/methenyltetrahydrofolate cyclohydrolase
MSAALLDGKAIAKEVREEVATRNASFQERFGRPVGLVVVRVGDDPASEIYVRGKRKAALEAGLNAEEHHLPETTTQSDLLSRIEALNARPEIDAVLVQLPLPKQIDADTVIAALDPIKDVDGFHPVNAGYLATGRKGTRPCTPVGCLYMLDRAGVALEGRQAVVVGRSNIVGKPVALMLLERGCTVTICHSKTRDLGAVVASADVLVVAIGKAALVKGAWVKPGAAVIDVGMNRLPDGKLMGDVEFEPARERAAFITPVPGGVGPMTIAMLLNNAIDCAERRTAARRG